MARTLNEIETSIDVEALKHEELRALQGNTSAVSFWAYVKKIVAFTALTIEKMFESHKAEINSLIEATETGSADWYLKTCYDYQHGDSLTLKNNRLVYPTVNAAKKIIKRVSLKESTNATLFFKVAKESSGNLEELTNEELASFKTYLSRVKIAGTKLDIQSGNADTLSIQAAAILDPLLFNSEGKLLADGVTIPVLLAIKKYLRNFDFGSTLYLSGIIDSVMDIAGVKDFHISAVTLNDSAFTRSVESAAGYINLTDDSTISYVLS